MDTNENLLYSILRIFGILQYAHHQPVERVAMDLHQPPKGCLIAPFEPADQFQFVQVRISLMNPRRLSFVTDLKNIDRRNYLGCAS